MPVQKLKQFLDAKRVKYVVIRHSPAYTAQEVAASAHIPGRAMAKVVIVELDGELAMAVLPANRKVVLQDLQDITGSDRVRFASEEVFRSRFPDCEIGAMPPFGNLYGMEVFVAESLAQNDEIAFIAGSHEEVIQLAYSDFVRLVNPNVTSFTT
jgi:Ala-tRNA(Pro) deacylase